MSLITKSILPEVKYFTTGGFMRNQDGTFKQTRKPFSLENFNDGYVDADGRFRVYSPNHPRASNMGYVLRAIVAYELYHDVSVPKTMCVHHTDGNKLNDSKDNLVIMMFGEHTTMHKEPIRRKSLQERVCKHCGKTFLINRYRLGEGVTRGTFCSQDCYKLFRKAHMKTIEEKKLKIRLRLRERYKDPVIRKAKNKYLREWRHRKQGGNTN